MVTLTVITGPPCSGKSTYARDHAREGDIIIDFDTLAQALGSPANHGHTHTMHQVAKEARNAAIAAAIEQRRTRQASVWIVDTAPRGRRLQQYRDARARFITLSASREELHRRATAAGRPPEWHQEIDKFADVADRRDPAVQARTRW